jgi:hypothetical protein
MIGVVVGTNIDGNVSGRNCYLKLPHLLITHNENNTFNEADMEKKYQFVSGIPKINIMLFPHLPITLHDVKPLHAPLWRLILFNYSPGKSARDTTP